MDMGNVKWSWLPLTLCSHYMTKNASATAKQLENEDGDIPIAACNFPFYLKSLSDPEI